MPISCDTNDLAENAKCFCYPSGQQLMVQTYLLAQIAGNTDAPNDILERAKCFECMSAKQLLMIQVYLLCQLSNVNPLPNA